MYFKTDFYFFLRDFRCRDTTSFKRFSKETTILGQSLYRRYYAKQHGFSCFFSSRLQNTKQKKSDTRREAFGSASFVINTRVLQSKKISPYPYSSSNTYNTESLKVTQYGFGITRPEMFAFKSLTQQRSPDCYKSKASRKAFLYGGLKKKLALKKNQGSYAQSTYEPGFLNQGTDFPIPFWERRGGERRGGERRGLERRGSPDFLNPRSKSIQKERANNVLSGEVFKERFTDILQTSLEQVGFSLESHNQKFSKACRATLWKKLQNGTNRRLPYFTRLFFSFLFSFPQKRAKQKKENLFFPWGLQISHLRHQSFQGSYVQSTYQPSFLNQALRMQAKAREGKRNQLKKLPATVVSKSKTLLDNNKADPLGGRFHSHVLLTKSGKELSGFRKAGTKVPWFNHRKRLCSTKVGLCAAFSKPWVYSESRHIKAKKIALTIKIGDYLSSGDQIGEKILCKKRILQKSKSLYPHPFKLCLLTLSPKALVGGVRLGGLHVPYKEIQSNDKSSLPRDFDKSTGSTSNNKCKTSLSFPCPLRRRGKGVTKPHSISTPIILGSSGRVVTISKTQVIVQKTQPVLFYKSANLHVKKGSWVKQGSPILTLTHQTLITGDIVQGIPRIEQLFEAFTSPPPAFKEKGDTSEAYNTKFKDGYNTLHSQVRDIFRNNWLKNRFPIAVRKSLEEIGYILVEMIQKVYLSQGVLIADKHIEIIVRQIASKGQILDSGSTGLFLEEVLPIRQIENANLTTPGKKCLYVPAVMGLTAAALNSDSFISAASFQETTRVLSRDAIVGKSDFLRGLKEKVVIGDLISAGTGLDLYFIYTTMLTN